MPSHLVFRSPLGERTIALDRPVVVGREASCDVAIESVRLSRRHAEFAPEGADGNEVRVRDLGSRNGVFLNGQRIEDGTMRVSDRVLLGDVSVTLRVKGATTGTLPLAAAGRDTPPYSMAAPAVAPPAMATPLRAVSAEGPAGSVLAGSPADDKTRLLVRPAPLPADADVTTRLPGKGASPAAAGPSTAPAREKKEESRAVAAKQGIAARLKGRARYGTRLTALTLVPTAIAFLITSMVLSGAFEQTAAGQAVDHAATIVRLLAAENRIALAQGQRLAVSARSALDEPGVQEALVIDASGRVLAPPNRLDTVVTSTEGFSDLQSLQGVQTVLNGPIVEAAVGIDVNGQRAGIVWIRFDRDAASGRRSNGLALFGALVASLMIGGGTGGIIRRMTMRRLEAFGVDVELAVAGRHPRVTETQGFPPLEPVAEAVNYLIERSRGVSVAAAAPQAASVVPTGAGGPGTLRLDAGYVVREADADAGRVLNASVERLVGRHVLEAVENQALAIAVIDLLGELAPGQRAQRVTPASAGSPVYEIVAVRDANDGGVRLTLQTNVGAL
jgi:hypothetical protein